MNFHQRRTFFFSDVCLTQCSLCESYSSNWFRYYCAHPGNRCRIRRLTVLWQATHLSYTFGRMPILTKWFGGSTFQELFTRRSIEFLRVASTSGISFSRLTSVSCFWILWLRGWYVYQCRFCTIVTLMPETALVSLRTLLHIFPLVTNFFSSFDVN